MNDLIFCINLLIAYAAVIFLLHVLKFVVEYTNLDHLNVLVFGLLHEILAANCIWLLKLPPQACCSVCCNSSLFIWENVYLELKQPRHHLRCLLEFDVEFQNKSAKCFWFLHQSMNCTACSKL